MVSRHLTHSPICLSGSCLLNFTPFTRFCVAMGLLLVMLVLVVCSISAHDYFGYYNDQFAYKVNDFLDKVLQEYKDNVSKNGNETMKLVEKEGDWIVIGGFGLSKPNVIKMPLLKRIGDAWLVSETRELYFKLGLEDNSEMVISGEKLFGPDWSADNPTIHVREILMTPKPFRVLDCATGNTPNFEKMSSVVLKVGDVSYSLDSWVNGHITQISTVLDHPFNQLTKEYFDHCKIMKAEGYIF